MVLKCVKSQSMQYKDTASIDFEHKLKHLLRWVSNLT